MKGISQESHPTRTRPAKEGLLRETSQSPQQPPVHPDITK